MDRKNQLDVLVKNTSLDLHYRSVKSKSLRKKREKVFLTNKVILNTMHFGKHWTKVKLALEEVSGLCMQAF